MECINYLQPEGKLCGSEVSAQKERLILGQGACGRACQQEEPFLSVCIPSYNRGALALRAVKHALEFPYETKVEIILSNNGSTVGAEEYHMIRDLKDPRVRYHEFDKNEGFATNLYQCLKMAQGRFAVFFSDEDILAVECLDAAAAFLREHGDFGGCMFNDLDGAYRDREAKIFDCGIDAVFWTFWTSYITGICFNMERFRERGMFERVQMLRGNQYVEDYFHCACLLMMAEKCNMADAGIPLWKFHEDKDGDIIGGMERVNGIAKFAMPESRLLQEKGALELAGGFLFGEMFQTVLLEWIGMTFGTLSAFWEMYPELMKERYSWPELCMIQYKNCQIILKNAELEKDETAIATVDQKFFHWLDCRRIRPFFTAEENLKATLLANTAEYLYRQGCPFAELDFKTLDEKAADFIRAVLETGGHN